MSYKLTDNDVLDMLGAIDTAAPFWTYTLPNGEV